MAASAFEHTPPASLGEGGPSVAHVGRDAVQLGADPLVARSHLDGSGAVSRLEAKLRRHYRKRYALTICNATTALHAIALALKVPGRHVVTTPLTWGGTLAGTLTAGGLPLFADVDPVTLALSPETVRKQVSRKTVCIIGVDLFGVPLDDAGLRELADELGVWYIHDAAQSFGASIVSRPAGARAHAVVLSFTAGKALDASEGGAVVTDDDNLYERLVWLTQHPDRQRKELGSRLTNQFALNGRIHPLAALIADQQFECALRAAAIHTRWCSHVTNTLDSSEITQPLDYRLRGISPSYYRLTAAWAGSPRERDLTTFLGTRGIEANIRALDLIPLYREPAFRMQVSQLPNASCPVAEDQAGRRFEILHAVGARQQESAARKDRILAGVRVGRIARHSVTSTATARP